MVAFGLGQVAEGVKNSGFNTFLLFYYQQVIGVSGTLTGLALGLALVVDAVSDPIVGSLSDRYRSRWGRRHPFLMLSAVPLAVSFALLFSPPDGLSEFASFLWLACFAIAVRLALTFYHVPHLALGAEMAQNYDQRSTLFAFSTLFGIIGGALTSFFAYQFFFPTTEQYDPGLLNPDGYLGFGTTFAVVMVVAIAVCVLGTYREIPRLVQPLEASEPFAVGRVFGEVRSVLHNKSFRALFFGMLFTALMLSVEAVFQPFMGVHFWGLRTEQLKFSPLAALAGLLLSLPLTPLATRLLDKKLALLIPAALAILNANVLIVLRLTGFPWLPGNESPVILGLILFSTMFGASVAPVIFSTINSMFADIADEYELETGHRSEGLIYSARSFALKAASSLGLVVGGALLDLISFPKGAAAGAVADGVIWNLGFVQGPATSIFTLCGLTLFFGYRLDRRRHAEIVAALAARHAESETASREGAGAPVGSG